MIRLYILIHKIKHTELRDTPIQCFTIDRCYEPASRRNKLFKISRIESVEITCEDWQQEASHQKEFTDYFWCHKLSNFTISLYQH